MTAAERIAAWATGLEPDAVPEDVRTDAKLHVLDAIGCGLAAHATGVAHEGRATMSELGGRPEATVIGTQERLPAANAAFANAMLCHGLDYDDTHSDSVSHVSTVVAPAALAAAEQLGATGRDTLAAIVAGNEVVCRIGMAASGAFHARGFHPTAICGIFGGVAAVGRVSRVDPTVAASALGIAGSFAGGLFAYLADGTPTKPMNTLPSPKMNSVRLAFSVSRITIEPISVTTWVSRDVMFVVSMVRIWVTSLDRRETISPTRRMA